MLTCNFRTYGIETGRSQVLSSLSYAVKDSQKEKRKKEGDEERRKDACIDYSIDR